MPPSPFGRTFCASAVSSTTHSANESLKLYIRPVRKELELLVPAYFSAAKDSPWTTLVSGAKSYPDVKITAIMNPNRQRSFIGIGFAVPIEAAAAGAGLPPF